MMQIEWKSPPDIHQLPISQIVESILSDIQTGSSSLHCGRNGQGYWARIVVEEQLRLIDGWQTPDETTLASTSGNPDFSSCILSLATKLQAVTLPWHAKTQNT